MVKQGRRTPEGAGRRVSTTTVVVGVIVLAAIGVVAYYSTVGTPPNPRASECTPTGKHEHASYAVFVDNSSVSWEYPEFYFDNGAGRIEGHIHRGASHTMHMEGTTTCTTVGRFFSTALLTRVTEDVLVLDRSSHQGASYQDGEGGELRFFLGKPSADWYDATPRRYLPASQVNWTEAPDLPHHQPADGEYLLITFGNETDSDIRWQQMSIPIQVERE